MNAEQLKPKAIKASERFLESRGYEILETGWECAAGGADIIARDEAAVVFVEVNARTGVGAGFPAEAGTEAKRAKFERCQPIRPSDLRAVSGKQRPAEGDLGGLACGK